MSGSVLGLLIGSVVGRVVVLAGVRLAATEASLDALGYGAVAVPLVVAASYVLTGRPRGGRVGVGRRARGILWCVELAGWVLWRSVVGGLDVARRALWLPRPDIAPEWFAYTTALATPTARGALALVANLMPGSLTARLDGDRLEVHAISPAVDVAGSLDALEGRIARIERVWSARGRDAGVDVGPGLGHP
ncbi:Na+/H+ antiporter subunit E [Microbacterium sp. NM3R9]|uniref:Na+/H+ antiporter subunit E n=1 Tax=Microbacterium thalli TaxID=3027921 RepID=UPI002365D008|nr:Na+/H+ antiporter subunit E [Microbacterium thalli]MDN8550075.1 Na+/H+ antiporter subunit E [Microbacterium thalli]